MSERLELWHGAFADSLRVAAREIVAAEVVIELDSGERVRGDGQARVRDAGECREVSLRPRAVAFAASIRPARSHFVASARSTRAAFASGFVDPGEDPGPGREVLAARERAHVMPIPAISFRLNVRQTEGCIRFTRRG
jgi:hypothetical protein